MNVLNSFFPLDYPDDDEPSGSRKGHSSRLDLREEGGRAKNIEKLVKAHSKDPLQRQSS